MSLLLNENAISTMPVQTDRSKSFLSPKARTSTSAPKPDAKPLPATPPSTNPVIQAAVALKKRGTTLSAGSMSKKPPMPIVPALDVKKGFANGISPLFQEIPSLAFCCASDCVSQRATPAAALKSSKFIAVNPCSLPCGHTFCFACLNQGSTQCPSCLMKYSSKDTVVDQRVAWMCDWLANNLGHLLAAVEAEKH